MSSPRKRGTPTIANAPARNPWLVKPRLVGLEDRTAPAVARWVGDVDNKWSTDVAGNTNWYNVTTGTDNYLPVNGDDLLFDDTAAGNFTNTDDLAALTQIGNVTINQA